MNNKELVSYMEEKIAMTEPKGVKNPSSMIMKLRINGIKALGISCLIRYKKSEAHEVSSG